MSSTNIADSANNQTDEEKDPLEVMLDKTGCKEVHYSLQVLLDHLCLYNVLFHHSIARNACTNIEIGENVKTLLQN